MIITVKNGSIYYITEIYYAKDYYNYVLSLFIQLLYQTEMSVNFILGDHTVHFGNNKRVVRVHLNYEHTLVKKGGVNAPMGVIPVENSRECYLVRVNKRNQVANLVVDYSIPNIVNIIRSNLFPLIQNKCLYVSPALYPPYFVKEGRSINTLTTFINSSLPRRSNLLSKLDKRWNHKNVNNCFDKEDLGNLYKITKIVINIHQTDYHQTFEELRVLPALLCGALVVCEDSPLKEFVPYHDYVIWSSYDTIANKVNEVLENYDEYFDAIFRKEKSVNLATIHNLNLVYLKRLACKP